MESTSTLENRYFSIDCKILFSNYICVSGSLYHTFHLEHVFRLHLSYDQFQEHIHGGLRSSLTLEFYKKAYDHIITKYPYWSRSAGKDHIWVCSL